MAYFVSYAQNAEDVMLWRGLGGSLEADQTGFYIDLGAGDPVRDSVTKAFYERGWRGVNVEVNSCLHVRLSAKRPEDVNLNIAVGSGSESRIPQIVEDDNRFSTTVDQLATAYAEAGYASTSVAVLSKTLTEIYADFLSTPIHFLKVDVEGAEADVLIFADFITWRPWIIVIEALNPLTPEPAHEAWQYLLEKANYYLYSLINSTVFMWPMNKAQV